MNLHPQMLMQVAQNQKADRREKAEKYLKPAQEYIQD
jgi:hypothetical protein